MTPLASLPVAMYSDARNVLTGVIESPETLSAIARMYVKTLIWYLIGHLVRQQKKRPTLNHEKAVEDGVDNDNSQESSGDQVQGHLKFFWNNFTCSEAWSSMDHSHKGASIYDVRKIVGILDPSPPCPHSGLIYSTKFMQPPLLHLLLG